MGSLQCRWVRDRLPLLAGDELRGADLRRVERHLIQCVKCRQHRLSLDQSMQVLHLAAAQPLVPSDAPSLWPELARQIRHSRPPARAPLFSWPRRYGLWPAFGLGLGLVAAVVAVGVRHEVADARSRMVDNAQPIPVDVAPPAEPAAPVVPPAELIVSSTDVDAGSVAAASSSLSSSKPQAVDVTASAENVPATRFGYDLDHALPMPTGNEAREGKQPTY